MRSVFVKKKIERYYVIYNAIKIVSIIMCLYLLHSVLENNYI